MSSNNRLCMNTPAKTLQVSQQIILNFSWNNSRILKSQSECAHSFFKINFSKHSPLVGIRKRQKTERNIELINRKNYINSVRKYLLKFCNKNTTKTPMGVVLVSLLLPLNRFLSKKYTSLISKHFKYERKTWLLWII